MAPIRTRNDDSVDVDEIVIFALEPAEIRAAIVGFWCQRDQETGEMAVNLSDPDVLGLIKK